MSRLLLVDAYALIYRAYYAFISNPRTTSSGENTSAVFGFIITFNDLLKRLQPTHIAVAFDPKGKTFRHEAYPEYKAQREATPEDIHKAVPVIKELLAARKIEVVEAQGFEADDVVGTLAKQAAEAGVEVYMATPDKDYGQLVGGNIFQYRPRHTGGFEKLGEKEICEKYGLQSPSQVIDLLALMGDAADNVPGCKGVGEKTAVKLLTDFGTVENMLAHTAEIKGALKEKVETQKDAILFSKYLVTIRLDAPVSWDAERFAYHDKPDTQALSQIYKRLEFNSLLRDLPGAAEQPVVQFKAKPAKRTASDMPDLFSGVSSDTASSGTAIIEAPASDNDTIENRLCAYLLNPERSFNPAEKPDWDALKADSSLWNLYNEVELPLVEVLRDMEKAGVRIDTGILRDAQTNLEKELADIEQDIYNIAGMQFNINSPAQVGEVLFDRLHLDPKAKRGKNGRYSTSEEVLLSLKGRNAIVERILEQRELKKLISTYIAALPTYINPETGKIHTHYNQTVTATGRLSSSNPNLQNLPIRTERGQVIRRAVIPDDGCLFVSADYSQIELRLMAHFSGDEHLLAAFRSGQDIHAATAAKIFQKPIEEITKEERRRAKTANFGIIYGISSFGLSQQLGCSRAEAKALIDSYFAAFPKVVTYIKKQKDFARANGYAETLFGRKRYLPDINSRNAVVRAFAERNAVNAPIQGTAADIIKIAMVSIHRRLKTEYAGKGVEMIMQVHDELNFNVPAALADEIKTLVVSEMENAVHLSVPLVAECGIGHNWLEAH